MTEGFGCKQVQDHWIIVHLWFYNLALPKQGNRKDRKGKDVKGHLTCRVPRDEHHSIGGDLDAATAPDFGDESEGCWAVSPLIRNLVWWDFSTSIEWLLSLANSSGFHLQNCSNGFSLQKASCMSSLLFAVVKSRMGNQVQLWALQRSRISTLVCGYMLCGSCIAFCDILCGLAEIAIDLDGYVCYVSKGRRWRSYLPVSKWCRVFWCICFVHLCTSLYCCLYLCLWFSIPSC